MYDSRNPKNGCRTPFVTCGQDKIAGLSMSQAAARRNTNWTTPEHRKGGCFTAGVGTFARTIKSTPSVYRERTPGRKGPGSAIKRKTNTVCRAKILKPAVQQELRALDDDRVRMNAFKRICREHAGMVGAGADADVLHYDERRAMFLEQYPAMMGELDRVEAAHCATIVVGRRARPVQQDQTVSDRRSVVARVRAEVLEIKANRQHPQQMSVWSRGANADPVNQPAEPHEWFVAR